MQKKTLCLPLLFFAVRWPFNHPFRVSSDLELEGRRNLKCKLEEDCDAAVRQATPVKTLKRNGADHFDLLKEQPAQHQSPCQNTARWGSLSSQVRGPCSSSAGVKTYIPYWSGVDTYKLRESTKRIIYGRKESLEKNAQSFKSKSLPCLLPWMESLHGVSFLLQIAHFGHQRKLSSQYVTS